MIEKKTKNKKPWLEFDFYVTLQVRWRDLDGYNHATNSVYLNYFEEARIGLFHKIKGFRDSFEEKGKYPYLGSTLVRTSIEFKNQAFLGQTLICAIRIDRVQKCFLDTIYSIYDKKNATLIAKGTASNVIINKKTFRPVTIPDEIMTEIQKLRTSIQ